MKKKKIKNKIAKPVKKISLPSNIGKKMVLHIGAGEKVNNNLFIRNFKAEQWHRTSLDSNPATKPDIISTTYNLSKIDDGSFDGVFSSHNIQLLYAHQADAAFREYFRVLREGGTIVLSTPDLVEVAKGVTKKGLDTELYKSAAGSISAIDIIYGFRPALEKGDVSAGCKTGFSVATLGRKLKDAGFCDIVVRREKYNLLASGNKRKNADKNQKIRVVEEDINEMMVKRDNIEKEPESWPYKDLKF